MIDFGIVRPGTVLYVPFNTFDSNDPSASVTLTGLATTDIEIYKDGGTTQRASDSGYALLDTDGIDFDGITGIHGFSVDLGDNATAGFYAAGSQYWIVVASITVDAGTVNFIAATFRIGYPAALLNTTIATLASQTSFTLTSGPAEDDALNGMWCVIHDVASAVQCGWAQILDYTGSTKTVTLVAGTTFTAAASDNISVMMPSPLQATTLGNKLDVSSGGEAGVDWANVGSPTTTVNLSGTTVKTATDVETDTADIQTRLPAALVSGRIDASVGAMAAAVVTAAAIATDAIGGDEIAASAVTKIQAGLATPTNITAGTITTATNVTTVNGLAANVITAASIATDAIDSDAIAASAVTEIQSGLATSAELSGIQGSAGAALSFDASASNVTGALKSVTFVGTQSSGTYANTSNLNGVFHIITDTANAFDVVYKIPTGSGLTAISGTWDGYLTGGNDSASIQMYNFAGLAWETVATITGTAGTTVQNKTWPMYSRNTGADGELGDVYIRIVTSGMTTPTLGTDRLYISATQSTSTVGYDNAAVWCDTDNGTSTGTTFGNDGTVRNRCNSIANAITIARAAGYDHIELTAGNSATLSSSVAGLEIFGENTSLALGGQNISNAFIQGVHLSGTGTCAGGEAHLEHCEITTATLGNFDAHNCGLSGTLTLSQTGDYQLINCYSQVAGSAVPVIDMGAAVGAQTMSVRNWRGGLTLNNLAAGDVITLDGVFGTITLNGADATVEIRGIYKALTNNLTGTPTVGVAGAIKGSDVADILVDTAEIGLAGSGLTSLASQASVNTIDDFLDTEVAAIIAELAKVPKSDSTVTWNATALPSILTQVNAAIDTAISELGVAQPTATPTLRTGLMLLYMALRNKLVTQTSGTDALEIYNDAGTKITQKLLTDDGSDYTEAKMT